MPRTASGYRRTLVARLEAAQGCVGYEVLDPLGRKVGGAEKVIVNGDGEPEYVRVKMGWFARKSVLIPAQFVAVDAERRTLTLG